jgi:DNA-binding response OmpR family regulator
VATTRDGSNQPAPAVLVIDDEDYVADMLATALDLEGYAVSVAYNGQQGFDLARSRVVDLVVIDIMMPYLNGHELALLLRQQPHLYTVPIIMISAGARPRQPIDGMTFMPKPFDINQFLELVARTIGPAPSGAPVERRDGQPL